MLGVRSDDDRALRIGLAFSGGGFRATLFHLGVVRRLQERGLLSKVHHICSVSGGSILAAHLVNRWEQFTDNSTFDQAARPIFDIARCDLRGRIVRTAPWFLWQAPFKRFRVGRSDLLRRHLRKRLGLDRSLSELSSPGDGPPHLEILATNISRGSLAVFSKHGLVLDTKAEKVVAAQIPADLAVATSAAFPAFFPPVRIDNRILNVDLQEMAHPEYFSDGGVFDNLGIRRFKSLLEEDPGYLDLVLVSDASGAFDWATDRHFSGILGTALRATDILAKRIYELECASAFSGDSSEDYWPVSIQSVTESSQEHIPVDFQKQLKHIRTDLDRFSLLEIGLLAQHGYQVAHSVEERLPVDGTPTPHEANWFAKQFPVIGRTSKKRLQKAIWNGRHRRLRLLGFDLVTAVHLALASVLIWSAYWFATSIYEGEYQARASALIERMSTLVEFSNTQEGEILQVSALPTLDLESYQILHDDRVVDLRGWRKVADSDIDERTSPAVWTRTVLSRKLRETDELRLRFSTSGLGIDLRCLSHPRCRIERSFSPSATGERIQIAYDAVVGTKDLGVGDEITVRHQATYWNGFQDEKEEFIGLIGSENPGEISLMILFPESKPVLDYTLTRYERRDNQTYGEPVEIEGGAVLEKNTLFWKVTQPLPRHNYRVTWRW